MAKKRVSKYKKAYMKERRRIQRFIRAINKRGFITPEEILPQIPKKITQASINRLKRINPEYIYKKSSYASDLSYGEVVKASEGLKLRKEHQKEQRAYKREIAKAIKENTAAIQGRYLPKATIVAYNNVVEDIFYRLSQPIPQTYKYSTAGARESQAYKEERRQTLLGALQREVEQYGKEALGERFIKFGEQIGGIIDRLFYASKQEDVDVSFRALLEIIKGRSLTYAELTSLQDIEDNETAYSEY